MEIRLDQREIHGFGRISNSKSKVCHIANRAQKQLLLGITKIQPAHTLFHNKKWFLAKKAKHNSSYSSNIDGNDDIDVSIDHFSHVNEYMNNRDGKVR